MRKANQRTSDIVEALRAEINFELDDVIAKIVSSLPEDYFKSLSRSDQLTQLKALLATGVCQLDQEIMLRGDNGRMVGVISRQNYPGLLADILKRLPRDHDLVSAKIFTSTDHNFIIDLFEFQTDDEADAKEPVPDEQVAVTVSEVHHLTGVASETIQEFIQHYPAYGSILRSPRALADHLLAFQEMSHANDIVVRWDEKRREETCVTISAGSSRTRELFERAARFFSRLKLDIEQASLMDIKRDAAGQTAIARFTICGRLGSGLSPRRAAADLRLFLRLDQDVVSDTGLPLVFENHRESELALALARLAAHLLKFSGKDLAFQQINRVLASRPEVIKLVVSAIIDEKPMVPFGMEHLGPTERQVVSMLKSIANACTASNYHQSERRSLTMRLDHRLFDQFELPELPYAVFYVFGNGFDGFHVRFREVARGGMRLVRTRNQEHHLTESTRGFEEVFRLASAQQLKNKDIAEGGAKAIIILKPEVDPGRAGRDFVDGLLDVLLSESANGELLYLGPDENVTPELIEWVVERSRARGYAYPESLMSSKPKTGINHKEFGVTSEGVTVFLKRALRFVGIDPSTDSFTVKLTGGPDGDVAGNEMRILIREFGERVKIIAVADGSGAAVDLEGLDHDELLRLVRESRAISEFDPRRLTKSGAITGLGSPADIAIRNDLQFNVRSDVFIPAGGRPSSINAANWESYFDKDGIPAARVIVEGANLFVDEHARKQLSDRGVVIVKDSSANKCGVICSSLEIIAGMLLNNEQFLAIKPEFVEEVLELLRELADNEAICLFNEQPRAPEQSLPELSVLISKQILHLGDLIYANMGSWSQEELQLADEIVLRYLPRSLAKSVGGNVMEKIPHAYRNQLVAAILSSRVVYREGVQNLRNMRSDALAKLALDHLRLENETLRFMESIDESGLANAETIKSILRHSGSKALRELGN